MMNDSLQVENGFFLITDITGYTLFLTESELTHAHHIIQALFDAQLKAIKSPLRVSNFQGDAILCYAVDASIQEPDFIFQQVNQIYRAFSNSMAAMQVDPPCGCTACSNIKTLDLKIFLHYGDFILKSVGDRQEILGSDVILAHRMMKNDVVEKTGIQSYLLITKPAFNRLEIDPGEIDLQPYSQSYEHIGKVEMLVGQLF